MATEKRIPVEKSLENQQVICICGLCKKTFDTSIKLRMHLFSHFPEFQSKCVYCQQNFTLRRDMVIHMETLHHMTLENVVDYLEKLRLKHNTHETKEGGLNELDNDSLQYSCNICGKQYSSRKDLIQHMRQMHPQKKVFADPWSSKLHFRGNVRYKCELCSVSFRKKSCLRHHIMLSHTADGNPDTAHKTVDTTEGNELVKEENCSEKAGTEFEEDHLDMFPTKVKDLHSCFHCNKTLHDKKSLDEHIRWHFCFKLYTCQICRNTYSNARYLKRHTRIHLGESVYTCNKCGELFPFHKVLKEHMIYEHGDKSVTCMFCRKVFTEEALNEHMKIHRTEDFRCKICGVSFQRLDSLERHMASHSDRRPHKCDICSKTYKSYEYLRKHKAGHKKVFKQCDICGKSVLSNGLYQHMIKHSDVKAFQCEVCSKFFKMKHQLKSHLLTHYDVRKHECEICGFKFKWAHHLRSHWKVAHKT